LRNGRNYTTKSKSVKFFAAIYMEIRILGNLRACLRELHDSIAGFVSNPHVRAIESDTISIGPDSEVSEN